MRSGCEALRRPRTVENRKLQENNRRLSQEDVLCYEFNRRIKELLFIRTRRYQFNSRVKELLFIRTGRYQFNSRIKELLFIRTGRYQFNSRIKELLFIRTGRYHIQQEDLRSYC